VSVSPEEGVDVSHHIRLGRGVRQDYRKNFDESDAKLLGWPIFAKPENHP
jgi:hypothetical protein